LVGQRGVLFVTSNKSILNIFLLFFLVFVVYNFKIVIVLGPQSQLIIIYARPCREIPFNL